MDYFICGDCGAIYFADTHEGFNCDYCPGKIRAVNADEIKEVLPFNFRAGVDYPCVSC